MTDGNANWPLTNSLVTTPGVCVAGWTGSPTRTCDPAGDFGEIINPCVQIMCPLLTADSATWASSAAGSATVEGTCDLGFVGAPVRSCGIEGSWGAATGTPCTRTPSRYILATC